MNPQWWPWYVVRAVSGERILLRASDAVSARHRATSRWRRAGLDGIVLDVREATEEEVERHLRGMAALEWMGHPREPEPRWRLTAAGGRRW